MRTIKFRAWDTDMREMVMVDGIQFAENSPKEKPHIIDQHNDIRDLSGVVLMQFTGLTDKNGKEIYEGDVISRIKYSSNYKVEWKELDAKFILKRIGDDYPLDFFELRAFNDEIEVIGNIYESPELLNTQSKWQH